MNDFAWRELAAPADARLLVDHPDVGCEVVEYPQGIPQGQANLTRRDATARLGDLGLPFLFSSAARATAGT
jgi:hypothetical protein